MIIRAIDESYDWLFGKGRNDYLSGNSAIIQNINTRLNSFLGDCFFDLNGGLDWFNLLGGKNQLALNLAISARILNTPFVVQLTQLFINLDHRTRRLTVKYTVKTANLQITNGFFTFVPPTPGGGGGGDVKSRVFAVSFVASASVDINVGIYTINAQHCSVTVLDPTNTYADEDFEVTRPDVNTITLTAGSAITANFNVLVFEAGT